jgi:lysophospholipase L1-like esterase
MKKILFGLLFCIASVKSTGQNLPNDTARYETGHYRERMSVFRGEPITKGKTIFLGNSITEFGDWQKLLNDPDVINRGIAGDNTFGVLARLDDIIARRPGKLFIEIGINDFAQDVTQQITIGNILLIVKRIHAGSPGTNIYVLGILPVNDNVKAEYPFAFNKGEQIKLINNQLMRTSKGHNYTYLDLDTRLEDKNGKLDLKYARPDGIHLDSLGYSVWIKFLKSKKYIQGD